MPNVYTRLPPVFDCTAMFNGEFVVANGDPETGAIAPAVLPDCVMLNT